MITALHCPHCRTPLSFYVGTQARPPVAGDAILCGMCRLFCVCDVDGDELVLRELTAAERRRVSRDPRSAALQATLATQPTLAAAMDSWDRHGAGYG